MPGVNTYTILLLSFKRKETQRQEELVASSPPKNGEYGEEEICVHANQTNSARTPTHTYSLVWNSGAVYMQSRRQWNWLWRRNACVCVYILWYTFCRTNQKRFFSQSIYRFLCCCCCYFASIYTLAYSFFSFFLSTFHIIHAQNTLICAYLNGVLIFCFCLCWEFDCRRCRCQIIFYTQ